LSLAVTAASAPPTSSNVRKRPRRSNPAAPRNVGGADATPTGRTGLRTNSAITIRPTTAKQRLTRNSEWNASGAAARIANASSGPSIAPVVSIARCTPKAVPRLRSSVVSEISASRGAVRMPLPVRSASTMAPIAPRLLPAVSSASRQAAETP
jgi:hypothetical protein